MTSTIENTMLDSHFLFIYRKFQWMKWIKTFSFLYSLLYINTKSTGGSFPSFSMVKIVVILFFLLLFSKRFLISNARDKVASNSESSRIGLVGFIPVEFHTGMENVTRKVLRKCSVRGKFCCIFNCIQRGVACAIFVLRFLFKIIVCLQVVFNHFCLHRYAGYIVWKNVKWFLKIFGCSFFLSLSICRYFHI